MNRASNAGAKCLITKRCLGRDARLSQVLLALSAGIPCPPKLGTISAGDEEHGTRARLGTGDVSNAQNNVHAAKRSGSEFLHPLASTGCGLRWSASASGGIQ